MVVVSWGAALVYGNNNLAVCSEAHRQRLSLRNTICRKIAIIRNQCGRRFGFRSLQPTVRRYEMSLGTILLIIVILMLLGVIPTWPHSREWGYRPSGILGLVLVILIVLLLLGKL
jgi:hypothetical protein